VFGEGLTVVGDRSIQLNWKAGRVAGCLDLTGLFPHAQRPNRAAVANGIAYDAANKRPYVTGKLWPYVFEIEPAPVAAEARTRLSP
jgi:glutamine cyclotransferase